MIGYTEDEKNRKFYKTNHDPNPYPKFNPYSMGSGLNISSVKCTSLVMYYTILFTAKTKLRIYSIILLAEMLAKNTVA